MKGEADLRRQLQAVQLGISVALMDEIERQAIRLVARMKAAAPVLKQPDRRRTPGELKDSIGWTWGDAPAGSLIIGKQGSGTRRSPRITIYAGSRRTAGRNSAGAFYATWVEFGTQAGVAGSRTASSTGGRRSRGVKRTHPGTVAQPYFWPAYRAMRQGIRAGMSKAINKAAEAAR